jgi:hypothetical protein
MEIVAIWKCALMLFVCRGEPPIERRSPSAAPSASRWPEALLVRRSLNVSDYHAFKSYAEQQETIATTLAWGARERPDLSDEEIAATWAADEPRPPDLQAAYAKQVARLRAIRVALAFRAADESSEVPDDFIDSLWTLKRVV